MDEQTLEMTGELAAMLDESDDELDEPAPAAPTAAAYVDPASIPTRFSLLKRMALSPAHYRHACQLPQDDSLRARLGSLSPERSLALRFGSALHQILLGRTDKVALYEGRRDPKAHKWKAFQKECSERGVVEILNPRETALVGAVAESILRHRRAMELLFEDTVIEQRIDWEYVGRPCRSTPDARRRARWIADLKSSVTAEPEAFKRHALRLSYHAQAALYLDAIEAIGEPRPAECYLIAVEKSPPYPVSVFRIGPRALEAGARLCRAWVERLNTSIATDTWTEYLIGDGELELDEELEL